jgi:hypothetical protein
MQDPHNFKLYFMFYLAIAYYTSFLLFSKPPALPARLAGVSAATIDRIERGESCRMEAKRKIILALGYALTDKNVVFPD